MFDIAKSSKFFEIYIVPKCDILEKVPFALEKKIWSLLHLDGVSTDYNLWHHHPGFFFLFLESLEPQGPDESESQPELQRWVILMHIEVVETLV